VKMKSDGWVGGSVSGLPSREDDIVLAFPVALVLGRPPLVGEVSANFCGKSVALSAWRILTAVILVFKTGATTCSFE
jgi:hypothetical protein